MSRFVAERFSFNHGGIQKLIRFILLCNDPEVTNKDIAKEYHMSEGNVTYLQSQLGSFCFQPYKEVLDYISEKTQDQLESEQKNLEFVEQQRSKLHFHDFKRAAEGI